MDFPTTLEPTGPAELLPAAEPTPFYGFRDRPVTRPDGTVDWERIPLTLDDACYPQEGDYIPQSCYHPRETAVIGGHLEVEFRDDPTALILIDTLVDWGVPGQRNTCPDVSAFTRVREPEMNWRVFPVKPQGARVLFVIELVSPSTRENDWGQKRLDYHRAGVPWYVVVDQRREDGPRRVFAWDWTPSGYLDRPADARGLVPLPGTGIALGLIDNRLHVFDWATGERLNDFSEERDSRLAADAARLAADAARQAAEQESAAERAARLAAEQESAAERTARLAADAARQAAEQESAAERAARLAAEAAAVQAAARAAEIERERDALLERLRRAEEGQGTHNPDT